jgi:hypothetical protein
VLANANNTEEETIVHASWNGATDVASWRVLAGPSSASLSQRATMPHTQFEDAVTLPRKYAYAMVQALAADGRVLGSSPTVKVIGFIAALWRAG